MTVRLNPVLTLILVVGIIGAQAMLPAPFLPDIARDLAATPALVGTALGGYGIATALSALLLTPRLDRLARGRVLGGALLLLSAALLMVALSPGLLLFAAGIAASGIAAGVLLPAAYATAGDLAPPDRRAAILGRVLLGWSLALVVGVPAGSFLGEFTGWRVIFGGYAAIALGVAAAALALPDRRSGDAPRPSVLAAVRVPGVVPLLIICWCIMAAFYGSFTYLGSYVRAETGSGAGVAGLMVLAYGAGFALAAGQARWIDRWGPGRMLVLAGGCAVGVYLLMPVAGRHGMALLPLMAAFGITQHMVLNSTLAWLGSRDPVRRGSIMAVNSAVTYAGLTCGTSGLGWVWQAAGFPAVAACSAALIGCAALIAWRLQRRSAAALPPAGRPA